MNHAIDVLKGELERTRFFANRYRLDVEGLQQEIICKTGLAEMHEAHMAELAAALASLTPQAG